MDKFLKLSIILILSYFSFVAYTQTKANYQSSEIKTYPIKSIVDLGNIQHSYLFTIQTIEEKPFPGGNQYELKSIKQKLPYKTDNSSNFNFRSNVLPPAVKANFNGNKFHGHVPNDNDLAISNDGKIVSVTNSIIYFYNKDSMLRTPIELSDFVDTFPQKQGKFDPKVIYDPEADRFIICFLNGFDDETSMIFMAFSQTNDPTGLWNIYTLPGNPLQDSSWSDFPMIKITKSELFFTINLLRNKVGNETWKNTFKQTVIWQINKNTGYEGKELKTKLYHDIKYEDVFLRNICPVQGGEWPIDGKMFFLSNKNFAIETDTFYVLEITGEMDNVNTKLLVNLSKSDSLYGVPPYADQPNNLFLETNDARVLDAVEQDGKILFVGNSINLDNNHASIYLGEISNLSTTKNIHLQVIKNGNMEYGYPSIEYAGKNGTDEFMVLMNHTSDTTFPGISSFFIKNGELSAPVYVKQGETKTNVQSSKEQRWGDYTGFQRKYNEDGIVWGSGYYGKRIYYNSFPTYANSTWIVELLSPTFNNLEPINLNKNRITTYPNPTTDLIFIETNNEFDGNFKFQLYDIQGNLVKDFGKFKLKAGKSLISLNLKPLSSGIYFLKGSDESNIMITEKIVVK